MYPTMTVEQIVHLIMGNIMSSHPIFWRLLLQDDALAGLMVQCWTGMGKVLHTLSGGS